MAGSIRGRLAGDRDLANPGVLGMLLGFGIVFAVAVLTWDGPRTLRRPSLIALALCIPALLFRPADR